MSSTFFSIFIPVYNAEKYIEECLDSVLAQSFTDYSIYIHDDNSIDNSYLICKRYVKKHSNVFLTHGDYPLSCIEAMNEFVYNCIGQYIVFLDNDDVLDKDFLKHVHNSLLESNSECAIVSYKYIDEYGNRLNWHTTEFNYHDKFSKNTLMREYLTSLNIEGYRWNKICNKKIYIENNINIGKKYAADIYYTFDLISNVNECTYVSDAIYYYRYRSTSDTAQNTIEKTKEMIDIHLSISNRAYNMGFVQEASFYKAYRIICDLYLGWHDLRKTSKREWVSFRNEYSWKRLINLSFVDTYKMLNSYKKSNEYWIKFLLKFVIVYYYYL